jgi:dCTP deaminase
MLLSDKDIKKYIKSRKIKIKPKPNFEKQLGPASLDIRLGYEFLVFNYSQKTYVDPKNPETFKNLTTFIKLKKNENFVLQPRQFVLASTLEEIELPDDIAAKIEGRSSWGRLGLIVHSTAGYIDPGFKGKLTLELNNIGMLPILLYPEVKICQLAFELLSSPAEVPYYKRKSSKYFGDKKVQGSKIYKDFKNEK